MKLSNYLVYFFCTALGCILGVFFCNYNYFEFDPKINLFELTSLVVTTGFGIYITVKISRVFSLQNSEKTLLIEEVKESVKILERINLNLERRSYDLKKIAGELKSLNEHLYLLETLFQSSHCKNVTLVNVRNDLRACRSVLTGWPVTNNIVTLDITSYKTSKAAYRMLKNRYFSLIFEINRK